MGTPTTLSFVAPQSGVFDLLVSPLADLAAQRRDGEGGGIYRIHLRSLNADEALSSEGSAAFAFAAPANGVYFARASYSHERHFTLVDTWAGIGTYSVNLGSVVLDDHSALRTQATLLLGPANVAPSAANASGSTPQDNALSARLPAASDGFTYRIDDGQGGVNTCAVALTVTPLLAISGSFDSALDADYFRVWLVQGQRHHFSPSPRSTMRRWRAMALPLRSKGWSSTARYPWPPMSMATPSAMPA